MKKQEIMQLMANKETNKEAVMKDFINIWTKRMNEIKADSDKTKEIANSQMMWRDLTVALGKDLFKEGKMVFEYTVCYGMNNTERIDVYFPETGVIVEMKSPGKDLDKAYEQAERYYGHLSAGEKRAWIICSDMKEFRVYNMSDPRPMKTAISFNITEIEEYVPLLRKILWEGSLPEEELTIEITKHIGDVYDTLLGTYRVADSERATESLNKFIMRFIFCAFAEDEGIFEPDRFTKYVNHFSKEMLPMAFVELYDALATPIDKRDSLINKSTGQPINDLAMEFPYIGGTLFKGTVIQFPKFSDEIKVELVNLLHRDWSIIPGSLFGTIFECTFNPEKRHKNGMHYTTTANIHKVIDLLFLNELKEEHETICEIKIPNQKKFELQQFHNKISELTFLDPACGSGNFLIETYKELRELENLTILELAKMEPNTTYELKVSCKQFYGIEYVDFAHQVAQMSMYIAVCQEYKKTCELCIKHNIKISNLTWETSPLVINDNIKKGNALVCSRGYVRDWKHIGNNNGRAYSYIFGNPPYLGYNKMDKQQVKDACKVFNTWGQKPGRNDYVANWFILAVNTIKNTNTKVGFVSTNSIHQHTGANSIMKPMLDKGIHLNFGYTNFPWDSAASVTCSIIGFSSVKSNTVILNDDKVDYINQYMKSDSNFSPSKKINTLGKVAHGLKLAYPTKDTSIIMEKNKYNGLYADNNKWLTSYVDGDYMGSSKYKYGWKFYNTDVSNLTSAAEQAKDKIIHYRETKDSFKNKENFTFDKVFQGLSDLPNTDYIALSASGSFNSEMYITCVKIPKNTIPLYGVYASVYTDEKYSVFTSHIFYLWMERYGSTLCSAPTFLTSVYNTFPNPDSYLTELAEYGKKISDYVESSDKTPNELFKEREGEFYELLIARDKIMDKAYGIPEGSTDEERLEVLKNKYLERVAAIEAAKEAEKAAKKATREAKKAAKKAETTK